MIILFSVPNLSHILMPAMSYTLFQVHHALSKVVLQQEAHVLLCLFTVWLFFVLLIIYIQCSQKESFRPETCKIIFSYRCGTIFFAPVYHGQSYSLVPKSFGFLSFWGNSGPLLGRKLTFLTTVCQNM